MMERNHRITDKWQFWVSIASIILTTLTLATSALWDMSSRLTKIEDTIDRIDEKMDTGFKHVSRSIDSINSRDQQLTNRVNSIFMKCCDSRVSESDKNFYK